ncbi:putative protein C12orf56 [Liparis tanakae]|uniref:Uncharacterized protein n=1 Tax=Liparis tanakae TaxID=230148 RepID=A0A4Z2FY23_9TELE|nr:putative protein C12orf56 [Liparis tanakae]
MSCSSRWRERSRQLRAPSSNAISAPQADHAGPLLHCESEDHKLHTTDPNTTYPNTTAIFSKPRVFQPISLNARTNQMAVLAGSARQQPLSAQCLFTRGEEHLPRHKVVTHGSAGPGTVMARTGSGALLSRRNIKFDSFLKRNTERAVYERIRAHEPCVVISETVNKVYMHAVLSDERVYLTEYPPRTLTEAFSFRRVRDVELVNDLPDFLHGKNRELCQHIRITYVTDKPAARGRDWLRREKRVGLPSAAPPSRRTSYCPTTTHTVEGKEFLNVTQREMILFGVSGCSSFIYRGTRFTSVYLLLTSHRDQTSSGELRASSSLRSASCPNPETLGLVGVPRPPSAGTPTFPLSTFPDSGQVPRRIGAALSRLLKRDPASGGEEREAELHLYAMSHASRLYLHLQSAWSSFIISSVAGELLVDLLHPLDVEATGLGVVHHGFGVVHADHAFGRLLHAVRSVPGVVDVLGREAPQDGQVAP